jgi:hypothetical protein
VLDTLIVAGLVLVWGWVLGKPFLAGLAGSLRRDPVGSFSRQLDVLGRAPQQSLSSFGRAGLVSPGVQAARRQAARRRQIFLALVISVGTSLGLSIVFGGVFTTLFFVMTALLVGYLGLAAVAGRRQVDRRHNVVSLRPAPDTRLQPRYLRAAGDR